MTTQEFFELLETNADTSLLFEYAPNEFVGANYHITEVKHVNIDAVDCGARTDAWNETIIQLWESPSEIGKTEYMTTYKATSILKKVAKMKPFQPKAELKIEYSNDTFHTAQLFVNDYEKRDKQLILKLAVQKTDCKAKSDCGVPETAVSTASDAKVLAEVEGSCTPGSGCC